MRRMLVYIAGPYSKGDQVENVSNAIEYAELLAGFGFGVIIPHLSMLWHLRVNHPVDFWYEQDLNILEHCDILLRIPGESWGADREVEHAIEFGIPVFYDVTKLDEWSRNLRSWESTR